MDNEIVQQWIVKRKFLLGDYQYRHVILIKNGNYYMSNGENGEYCEISKDEALKMINRPLY